MRRNNLFKLRPGHHLVICDLSGWKCWDDEVVETWDGMVVFKDFYEERHPQDFVRGVKEDTSVQPTRPESPDVYQCQSIYEEGVYDQNEMPPLYYKCAG